MTSDVIFGPSGEEWIYHPSSKVFDISTGSGKKVTIPTTDGAQDTSFTIGTEDTALVIVDMQNFFLDSSCMHHPNGLKAVGPIIHVVEWCRRLGIQVIWLNWGLTDHDMSTLPAGVQRGFLKDTIEATTTPIRSWTGLGTDLGSSKGRCLFAHTWNADIYPALKEHVQSSDLHCAKNRMSGMWNSEQPLWKALKRKGISTLLFAGVNTDQCVLGTLVDSYNAGWNCVLVDDCSGTTTAEGGREVSLYNIANHYGFVTDSESLVAAKVE